MPQHPGSGHRPKKKPAKPMKKASPKKSSRTKKGKK